MYVKAQIWGVGGDPLTLIQDKLVAVGWQFVFDKAS
jgi:hypothetical protein